MQRNSLIYWGLVFIGIGLFLQCQYSYFFFYQEQLQLFQLTRQYVWDTVLVPGGLVDYLAGFFRQFYIVPFFGALFTSLLLVSIGYIGKKVLCELSGKNLLWVDSLALIPIIGLVFLHTNLYYHLSGSIACLMCFSGWLIYLKNIHRANRWLLGIFLLSLVYLLAGPVYSLFIAGLVVCEWKLHRTHVIGTIASFLIAGGVWIILSLGMNWAVDGRQIIKPDFYCEFLPEAQKVYYVWGSCLLSILLGCWLSEKRIPQLWSMMFSLFLLLGGLYGVYHTQDRMQLYSYERDWYLRNQQWDKIIATFNEERASDLTMNVLNLALACQGELGNKMFSFPQDGSKSLLSEWDNSLMSAMIYSDICYQVGDIASSQKFAFEGYVTSTKGNVRLMQRLVETNIIEGNYRVAEKYIALLENTFFYKSWAEKQRQFLGDSLIAANEEYVAKRLSLRGHGSYAVSSNFMHTLKLLVTNNPQNRMAFEYWVGFILLNKNLSAFKKLYDAYYHTDIWPELSLNEQQAVIALEQDTPGNWAKMGVSLATEQAYGSFSQDLADKRGYINFVEEMKRAHGKTYWFYLLFKK